MKPHRSTRCCGTLASLFAVSVSATAIEVQDQAFDPSTPANSVDVAVDNSGGTAQTFTVGLSGTLSSITVYMTRMPGDTANVNFSILGTDAGGVPDDAQTFFSGSFAGGSLPDGAPGTGLFSLNIIGLGITVNVGDKLAMAFSRDVADDVTWRGETNNPYVDGGAFQNNGGGWTAIGGTDLGFRTAVDTVTPPVSDVLATVVTETGWQILADGSPPTVAERLFAGSGPGDVDFLPGLVTPDGNWAVQMGSDGIEALDLGDLSTGSFSYLGTSTPYASAPGVIPSVSSDSQTVVAATNTHFERVDLGSGGRASASMPGPAIGSLRLGVRPVITADDQFTVLVTDGGFRSYNVALNSASYVPFAGAAAAHPIPQGVGAVPTGGSTTIYPRENGWNIFNAGSGTATPVYYQGDGPYLPLSNAVKPVYLPGPGKAGYPSRDGIETLHVATATPGFIPYPRHGQPFQPITPGHHLAPLVDGNRAAMAVPNGIVVVNFADDNAKLIQFEEGAPQVDPATGMELATDVAPSPVDASIAYLVPRGFQIADADTDVMRLRSWDETHKLTDWSSGRDPRWTSDGRFCVAPLDNVWAAFDQVTDSVTTFSYAGLGFGGGMPFGNYPALDVVTDTFYIAGVDGFEEFNPAMGTTTLRPYAGSPSGPGTRNGLAARSPGDPFDALIEDSILLGAAGGEFPVGRSVGFTYGTAIRTRFSLPSSTATDIEQELADGRWINDGLLDINYSIYPENLGDIGCDADINSNNVSEFYLRAENPAHGNYTQRFLWTEPDQRTVRAVVHADLNAVYEIKLLDERQVGVSQSTDLDVHLAPYASTFPELVDGALDVAVPGQRGPDGRPTGDLTTTGLSLSGTDNRTLSGTLNAVSSSWYTVQRLDPDSNRPTQWIHVGLVQSPTHDISLYSEELGLYRPGRGETQGLLKVDDVFGAGAGQIPPGTSINSATLSVETVDRTEGTVTMGRMLLNWDGNTTWTDFGSDGISPNDIEASSAASAMLVGPERGRAALDVTADVSFWSLNPNDNDGWYWITPSTDRWGFASSDSPDPARRPTLTVDSAAGTFTYTQGAGGYAGATDLTIDEDFPDISGIFINEVSVDRSADGDIDYFTPKDSLTPHQFPQILLNSSSVGAGDLHISMSENSPEITLSGTTSGSVARGGTVSFDHVRPVSPTVDPDAYTFTIDYGAAGNLNQTDVWGFTALAGGPTLVVLTDGEAGVDPDDPDRVLWLATDPGQSRIADIVIVNEPSDLPPDITEFQIDDVVVGSETGATFEILAGGGAAVVGAGEQYSVTIRMTPTADVFDGRLDVNGATGVTPVDMSGMRSQFDDLSITGTGVSWDPANQELGLDFGSPEVNAPGSGISSDFSFGGSHDGWLELYGSIPGTSPSAPHIAGSSALVGVDRPFFGQQIDSGQSQQMTSTFRPHVIGSYGVETEMTFLAGTFDGATPVNRSFERITLTTSGQGVPTEVFAITDPKFSDTNPENFCLEYPVRKDNHYVVLISTDGETFERLEFEDPPGSGMVRDFFTAPTDKPSPSNPDELFKTTVPVRSVHPKAMFRVECYETLRAIGVTINDGNPQRSQLYSLCVFLNLKCNLPDLIADGTVVDAVKVKNSSGIAITLAAGDFLYDPTGNKLTISLENLRDSLGRKERVPDGYYDVCLDTGLIELAGDNRFPLLDEDGIMDGVHRISGREQGIYALFGDTDGSSRVDFTDFLKLSSAFNQNITEENKELDFDFDGRVAFADFEALSENFNLSIDVVDP